VTASGSLGRAQRARQPLRDLGPEGQHLVGQGAQLLGRDGGVADAAGDLLEPGGGGLQGAQLAGRPLGGRVAQRVTSASPAIRPRMPLMRPAASVWQ
jgi:hypothetical protein